MLPTRIELGNFTCYEDERVDLDGVRLAALVGPNGAGKSSLLDAITWALFGEGTKGGQKALDNYVRRGAGEASVAVEFVLHGQHYRVERSRSLSRQKTALRLLRREAQAWSDVGGKTVAEAQDAIFRLLRMDYRTFTASSLILQGQSDALTADMTDGERKEVLARILGLDLWDRLQEAARERLRGLQAEVQTVRAQIAQAERRAERIHELRHELMNQRQIMTAHKLDLQQAERELPEAEAAAGQLQILKQQAAVISRQIEQRLADRREIAADIAAEQARAQEERQRIKAEIAARERDRQACLEDGRHNEAQLEEHERLLARAEEIMRAVREREKILAALDGLDQMAARHAELDVRARELERRIAEWDRLVEAEEARLQAVVASAERQGALLAEVPCAGTEMQTACRLLAGAHDAVRDAERARSRLEEIRAARCPDTEAWQEAVRARDALGYDPERHRKLHEEVRRLENAARCLPLLERAEKEAPTLRRRLAELRARHQELEAEVASLRQRAATIAMDASRVGALRARLDTLNAEIAALEERHTRARQAAVDAQLASQRRDYLRQRVEELRSKIMDRQREIGRIEAEIAQAEQALVEAEALRQQAADLDREATVYRLLEEACSKRGGVPALVVENAVPEIERVANGLLARIAGGRMQVRLETQAETKAGTLAEVLRIVVLDQGQERPYQTYSGAERFMVDLALRVALSRFLAHRAGAEIQLLVLDEGLGALDTTNRHEVVEAIQEVARDFGRVLVITHIAELQDAFPQRIEVSRNGAGSRVRVMA